MSSGGGWRFDKTDNNSSHNRIGIGEIKITVFEKEEMIDCVQQILLEKNAVVTSQTEIAVKFHAAGQDQRIMKTRIVNLESLYNPGNCNRNSQPNL